jgi:hypothetical protein
MPIQCPRALCLVSIAIGENGKLVLSGGQCIELLATRYVHTFERCPVLASAIARNFKLPDLKD